MTQQHTRWQAIIAGALLGDALGTPLNGLKQGHVQQLTGGPVEGFLRDGVLMPEKPHRNNVPGIHGALGQQLLAATAVAVEDELGREPVARVAAQLTELVGESAQDEGYRFGSLRQPGRPLRRAVARWRTEYPWVETDHYAAEEESQGLAPAVLGFVPAALSLENGPGMALRLARLTHFHAFPVMAAVAVCRVAELLLQTDAGRKLDGSAVIEDLLPFLREQEGGYEEEHRRTWRELGWGAPPLPLSHALAPLASLLREANDDLAVRTIVNTAGEYHPQFRVTHVQHGFAPAGLAWALYRALGPMPGVQVLEDILNRGSETCAIASVAGGLLGARYGIEAFPQEWLEQMRGLAIAEELAEKPDGAVLEKWISAEHAWTAEEEAFRAPLREAQNKLRAQQEERERRRTKKSTLPDQGDAPFAPPPHLWLKPGEEEDPDKKKILKEARARRRIGWKEDRREKRRQKGDD